MPSLLPFRPWKFKDGDPSQISQLTEPERKFDDRSPFVRYARSAALWAEWVREDIVSLDPDQQMPVAMHDGFSFTFAVSPLSDLRATMSVPPAAKDHQQRLLESTQLYVEPIIVFPISNGDYAVVGNHELFAAAHAYQNEMARPGKLRPSDYCLVAVVEEQYLSTIQPQQLNYSVDKPGEVILAELSNAGYAVSPRTDDLNEACVQVEGQNLIKTPEPGGHWKEELSQILGIRSLDFPSNTLTFAKEDTKTKVMLVSPQLTTGVLENGVEFAYGSQGNSIRPLPGANMWSLRDFRI